MSKQKDNDRVIKKSIESHTMALDSFAMNRDYFMYMYTLNKIHHVFIDVRRGVEETMKPAEKHFYHMMIRNRVKTNKPEKYILFWKTFHKMGFHLKNIKKTKKCFDEMPLKMKYILYDGCRARRDSITKADEVSQMSHTEIDDELDRINKELLEIRNAN